MSAKEYMDLNACDTSVAPECCLDCRSHAVINDPDPSDWFCDDDLAVVCKKTANPQQNLESKHLSERSEFRAVEVAIRPYNLRKEARRPDWCPRTAVA